MYLVEQRGVQLSHFLVYPPRVPDGAAWTLWWTVCLRADHVCCMILWSFHHSVTSFTRQWGNLSPACEPLPALYHLLYKSKIVFVLSCILKCVWMYIVCDAFSCKRFNSDFTCYWALPVWWYNKDTRYKIQVARKERKTKTNDNSWNSLLRFWRQNRPQANDLGSRCHVNQKCRFSTESFFMNNFFVCYERYGNDFSTVVFFLSRRVESYIFWFGKVIFKIWLHVKATWSPE